MPKKLAAAFLVFVADKVNFINASLVIFGISAHNGYP